MILAIDPGLATFGWAIVRPRNGRVIALGVLESEPDRRVDEWTDRARRAALQAAFVADLVERFDCDTIAVEAVSCGGPPKARFMMGTALCLSWGVLVGIAEVMELELVEVAPKQWQHAIAPEYVGRKINYTELFLRLEAFVEAQQVAHLTSINRSMRNHALDAVGVGIFAALSDAVRIRATAHAPEADA